MKTFESICKLQEYAKYCPICKSYNRKIYFSIGPDDLFSIVGDIKVESNQLAIDCILTTTTGKEQSSFVIDCINNTFSFKIDGLPIDYDYKTLKYIYFYLYINATCKECNSSNIASNDLEFDFQTNKISNIGLEQESFYFMNSPHMMHVTLNHASENLRASRLFYDESTKTVLDDNKIFTCPIVDLDLDNHNRSVSKIRTLMLFS